MKLTLVFLVTLAWSCGTTYGRPQGLLGQLIFGAIDHLTRPGYGHHHHGTDSHYTYHPDSYGGHYHHHHHHHRPRPRPPPANGHEGPVFGGPSFAGTGGGGGHAQHNHQRPEATPAPRPPPPPPPPPQQSSANLVESSPPTTVKPVATSPSKPDQRPTAVATPSTQSSAGVTTTTEDPYVAFQGALDQSPLGGFNFGGGQNAVELLGGLGQNVNLG